MLLFACYQPLKSERESTPPKHTHTRSAYFQLTSQNNLKNIRAQTVAWRADVHSMMHKARSQLLLPRYYYDDCQFVCCETYDSIHLVNDVTD